MRNMTSKPRTRLLLACLAAAVLWAAPQAAAADGLTCDRVPELLKAYLNKHYSFRYLNDELRTRTVDSYIKRIDPSKSLFLVDEEAALQQKLQGVFHDIRRGDCMALLEIRSDVIERYKEVEVFVTEFVGSDDYELDTDVDLIIDPDKRARPRTEEDQKDLYRRLVHFQMSNYLSNGEDLAEAKRKLIHRYELMTRRAMEQDEKDVYGAFLDSFATALDPHSNYFTAEAVEDFKIGMELSLEGIGVALTSRDGYSVVEKVIPGGAADKLGRLEPQDKIIAVAQAEGEFVDIIDMDLRDVVRLIRGKRGTTVRLSILRNAEATERFIVSIVRDEIKLEDQAAALRFEQVEDGDGKPLKLAVLELPSFYGGRNPTERQSSRDMRDLLRKVKEEKADGLLLDLSRNGGGLLDNSVEIAGFFIRNGGVVAVKDTYSKVQVLPDPDDSLLYDGPMVLLTSRVSASASEIVAGAMKDYRRAIIVGDDHTFGKGTVQSMVNLPQDLGALKVTTALFFRPGGTSTQHKGVRADIVFPSIYSANELGEKHQDYSLPGQSIEAFLPPSPTLSSTDPRPWRPVTPESVAKLAELSRKRIEESEEFAEILEQIAETEQRNGVLHLADIHKPQVIDDASGKSAQDEGAQDGAAAGAGGDTGKAATGSSSNDQARAGGLPEDGSVASTAGSASKGGKEGADNLASIPPPKADREEPGKLEELSPQQREALHILADWVRLNG
jgi:carboxyl-terminal processing protease